MNVLYVYNYYQNPGGEDEPFAAEAALIEAAGHLVKRYSLHNDAIAGMNPLKLAGKLIWNQTAYKDIRRLVRENRIDVAHFHNTFPLISPAAYYAARQEGARVVHTLHNFRLICPNSFLSRDARVCEDCLTKVVPWPGIVHACYRDSKMQSAAVATMLAGHRFAGTWTKQIDLYIALSEFARRKFIQAGLPADRFEVKPNFAHPDPGMGSGAGRFALFVGRLSPNKGIDVLLNAWKTLASRLPLRIVGDGPLAEQVQRNTGNGIEYLGRQPREKVLSLMREASFLVFPSVWYEGFPMTIVEAYASGLPVIASNLGSMASIVEDHVTGLRFAPGDAGDLCQKVEWICNHPDVLRDMRGNARAEFVNRYSAGPNYTQLMRIYARVLDRSGAVGAQLRQGAI